MLILFLLLAGELGKRCRPYHFWFGGRKPLILMTGGVNSVKPRPKEA